MNRYFPVTLLLIAAVYFSIAGFQCGSAEATSAKLYMQQKQWEKAEESLLKEILKNDKIEEAWFLLGQVRLERKNYAGMNDAYTRARTLSDVHKPDIDRNRLAIWAMMYNEGVRYYNVGKDTASYYDKAIETFKTAVSLVPDSAGTYYVAALAYYAKKDYPGAQSSLETALQKKPGFADAARFLGQLYYLLASQKNEAKDETGAQAQYEKAASAFEIAYKSDPGNADNITNLIDVYERTKKSDKAMPLTRDAVARDPNNKVFRYAYGVFLLKQDKFPESVEQFKKAVEIDPNFGDAIYNCGVANLNWGVSLKAEVDKKAETEKKGTKARDAKEDITYKEKFKDALPFLEKSAELRGDDAVLWQQLGRLYAILNMVDKSRAAFEKSDKLMKNK